LRIILRSRKKVLRFANETTFLTVKGEEDILFQDFENITRKYQKGPY